MKTETILNAYVMADYAWAEGWEPEKYDRMRKAFRSRILKMFEELEAELAALNRPFDDPTGRYELTNEEWVDAQDR